jgi:hypothetical protein
LGFSRTRPEVGLKLLHKDARTARAQDALKRADLQVAWADRRKWHFSLCWIAGTLA